MRATPEELASRNDPAEIHDWVFTETEPRKIQQLFHRIGIHSHSAEYERARTAIEILISEQQTKASERLENHTKSLVRVSESLLGVTQSVLDESKALRKLTVGLLILTAVLLVLTAGLLIFTICLVVHK